MSKQAISVKVRRHGGFTEIQIEAEIIGELAVHPQVQPNLRNEHVPLLSDYFWTVTHRGTGLKIGDYRDLWMARHCAEELAELPFWADVQFDNAVEWFTAHEDERRAIHAIRKRFGEWGQ